ncbi:hypothetical protein GQX73_g9760 [Xylaria multiplex]|uniref:NIMA interactive protein n=1 Tax=Xylaria multiplex TaxID=323545 RepID=A0A7C8MYB2_9PEZI|nr:hypothetical protein GQX73_g9760 [Xylaria multiplex]
MIDPENLRTASLYINNQLLSRGLLRDGQNIDFADPEGSDGGLEVAMGRIISVVNDLILRRDRDAEHRESLSSTLRTLRTDVQRRTTEFARQTERLSDTQRRLDIAEATERALRTQLKTAEQGIHKLKEEMAKMKSIVGQTRSACATEVRKRDRQIETLKKAVTEAGRVRGGARSRDVITISVTGEFSSEDDDGMGMPVGATESEGYSLRMETNGFLTELAKGLSEENEGLLALVRRTVDGLREMSGLDRGTDPSHGQGQDSNTGDQFVTRLPQKSAEELASELEAIVEHLRSILTNPSFVPIEEVEVRDEAINRLRAGLETMEARWKDAVHMIDGWRRRMVSGGKSVDIEDLQIGLRLSPVRVRDAEEATDVERVSTKLSCVQEEEEEEDEENNVPQYSRYQEEKPEPRRALRSPVESLRLVPAPQYDEEELGDDSGSDSDSSIFQDDLDIDDLDVEEPNVQILQISTTDSIDSSPLPEPPQISPLKDSYSSGNRGAGHTSPHRKRPGDFSTIIEENTWDLAAAEDKVAPASPPRMVTSPKSKKTPPQAVDEDDLPDYTASYDSPLFGKSGERPTQAQLNRKLFSKPSEQRTRNTAVGTTATATTSQSQTQSRSRGGKESPPLTRTTRSSAKKSAETSPASSQMTIQTTKRTAGGSFTSTTSATAPPASISASTASTKKQAAEIAPRNAKSANSSTSSPSSTPSSPSSSSNTKQIPTRSPPRSPPRSQPTPAASSSSSSRLPRAHAHAKQSPLSVATIAAKLAASEREADAARVRAKLRAVRRNRRASGAGADDAPVPTSPKEVPRRAEMRADADSRTRRDGDAEEQRTKEDTDPVKRDRDGLDGSRRPASVKKVPRRRMSRGPVGDEVDELAPEYGEEPEGEGGMELGPGIVIRKRAKRTGKVASRRRSTLSPWELQGLISGRVGDVGSPAR